MFKGLAFLILRLLLYLIKALNRRKILLKVTQDHYDETQCLKHFSDKYLPTFNLNA